MRTWHLIMVKKASDCPFGIAILLDTKMMTNNDGCLYALAHVTWSTLDLHGVFDSFKSTTFRFLPSICGCYFDLNSEGIRAGATTWRSKFDMNSICLLHGDCEDPYSRSCTISAIASELVNPGLSMPSRFTQPSYPSSLRTIKSWNPLP